MDYLSGFYNFDCNTCGETCPTGIILPISIEEKQLTQLGKAVFVKDNCVDQSICIGCGACEHPCPVEAPFKAIYINGNVIHLGCKKPKEDDSLEVPVEEDFPF